MYIVTGIVLVRQDLRQVLEAILLARATLRTIRQNLVWAFLYNLTLIPLAAGVVVPLAGPGTLHLLPSCHDGRSAPSPLGTGGNRAIRASRPGGSSGNRASQPVAEFVRIADY